MACRPTCFLHPPPQSAICNTDAWICVSSRFCRRSPRPDRSPPAAGSCACRSRQSAGRSLLLEEELGEPLFLRVGRQVRMTPAAESLVQLGQRVFQDVRDTVGAITDRTRALRGTLRLAGGMTVCLYVFPPLLKHLKRVHPQLDIRLTVATAGRSVEEIRAGRVDAGLLTLPVEESDLVTVPVLREELLLVTMPTHPLARRAADPAGRSGGAAVRPVRAGLGHPPRHRLVLRHREDRADDRDGHRERRDHQGDGQDRARHRHRAVSGHRPRGAGRPVLLRADRRATSWCARPAGSTRGPIAFRG